MKGVLRTAGLFYTGNRTQVITVLVASLLLGVDIVWSWIDPARCCHRPEGLRTLDNLWVANVAASLMFGTVTFRAMAAPRTLRLIPGARLRLALGFALALLLAAGVVTYQFALRGTAARSQPLSAENMGATYGFTLSIMTLWVLWVFCMFSRSGWPRWLLSTGALVGLPVVLVKHQAVAKALGIGVLTEFAVPALVAAAVFCAWYFRARNITPPDLATPDPGNLALLGNLHVRPGEVFASSPEVATNVYLLGQPSVVRACRFWLLAYVAVMLLWLYAIGRLHSTEGSAEFPLMLALVSSCGTYFPSQIVRRARALWIRSGRSRRELFDIAERLSLGCLAFTASPLVILGAADLRQLPAGLSAYLLALTVATAFWCVYLTLLDVRRASLFQPYLIGFLVATWIFFLPRPFSFFEYSGTPALLIPGAELAAIPVLRAIALRRWQRIDWLICKPPRVASQRLRPAR